MPVPMLMQISTAVVVLAMLHATMAGPVCKLLSHTGTVCQWPALLTPAVL